MVVPRVLVLNKWRRFAPPDKHTRKCHFKLKFVYLYTFENFYVIMKKGDNMKIFKKIVCYSLIILFIPLIFIACKTKEPSYTDGLEYKLSSNGQYYILTDIGMAQGYTINIPNQFNGLDVKVIGESAFEDYSFIKKVIMPNSITTIERSAFKNCNSLTNIIFSNNLKLIDDYAFYNCKNLQNIDIPNSIEEIGDYSFYGCESFTILEIDENIKKIGKSSFYNCINLQKIKIPDTV